MSCDSFDIFTILNSFLIKDAKHVINGIHSYKWFYIYLYIYFGKLCKDLNHQKTTYIYLTSTLKFKVNLVMTLSQVFRVTNVEF